MKSTKMLVAAAALLMASHLSAQVLQVQKAPAAQQKVLLKSKTTSTPRLVAKAKADASAESLWWSYSDERTLEMD